eukprot:TRINITY_DN21582_c0_g1_i1.p1 TRINITY_DN21582_c0_g1~~TRINITY_DN21582_c0_g1_i1.p1  ORF type:complete len:249 (-),score=0.20 TRINITY_DN21582_c0_g1_i1:2-748(-)
MAQPGDYYLHSMPKRGPDVDFASSCATADRDSPVQVDSAPGLKAPIKGYSEHAEKSELACSEHANCRSASCPGTPLGAMSPTWPADGAVSTGTTRHGRDQFHDDDDSDEDFVGNAATPRPTPPKFAATLSVRRLFARSEAESPPKRRRGRQPGYRPSLGRVATAEELEQIKAESRGGASSAHRTPAGSPRPAAQNVLFDPVRMYALVEAGPQYFRNTGVAVSASRVSAMPLAFYQVPTGFPQVLLGFP